MTVDDAFLSDRLRAIAHQDSWATSPTEAKYVMLEAAARIEQLEAAGNAMATFLSERIEPDASDLSHKTVNLDLRSEIVYPFIRAWRAWRIPRPLPVPDPSTVEA